jgi:hypothetical protein
MRISCTRSSAGPIYRVYRSNDDFVTLMKRLIPYLRADQYDVLIGGTLAEPHVVLTIGPLDPECDAAFRPCVADYLEE